jgi:hypothetical protein
MSKVKNQDIHSTESRVPFSVANRRQGCSAQSATTRAEQSAREEGQAETEMRGHSINEILASRPRPVRTIPHSIEIPLHPVQLAPVQPVRKVTLSEADFFKKPTRSRNRKR